MPDYGVQKAREVVEAHKESVARAYQAGVKIAMGTDAGVMAHGTNLRELGIMCDIGMSPMEAIVAATNIAAECMGWDEQIGTIEKDQIADIVVTSTDTLTNIRSLENKDNIVAVLKKENFVKDHLKKVPVTGY